MSMRKYGAVAIFLSACIILSIAQIGIALGSLSKPTVTVPTNWVLKEETPYPDAASWYDPEGGGFLNYYNPNTNSFVMIYYESDLGATYDYNALRDNAYKNFQNMGVYPFEDWGTMEVADEPAGYVKAHNSDYDLYGIYLVFAKNNYYFNLMCGFPSGSQDEAAVYQLINSIDVGDAGAGFPIENVIIIIGVVVAVVVVVIVLYLLLKRRKKTVAPAELRITAEPASILADGMTNSVITVQLFDKSGKPIAALADTQVQITASKGKLENPTVTIFKGENTGMTTIVSSKESGQAQLSVKAEKLESRGFTLFFLDKKRYCMHCGAVMHSRAKTCQNCGKSPPAGVDTKECHNCKSVIPVVARFCSECGTGQAGVDTVCRNCRSVISTGARFCNNCGTDQKA